MPIVLTYLNGRQRLVQGESWTQLNNAGGVALGCVNLKRVPDGGKITVVKSALAEVEEIPQATWDAQMAEHEKAEAKKAADAALLALLESKTLRGRVKRMFGGRLAHEN